MRRLALVAAAAPLLVAASPEQENLADARCLTALAMVGGGQEGEAARNTQVAMTYYMGRLDGRAAAADLKPLFVKVASELKAAEVAPLLQRCGGLLQQRGAAYQAMGKVIADAGK